MNCRYLIMSSKKGNKIKYLLVVFLLLPLLFGCNEVNEKTIKVSNEELIYYEEKLDIDLPYSDDINKTTYEYKNTDYQIMFNSIIEVDYSSSSDIEIFEKTMLEDKRFQNRLNTQLYVPLEYESNSKYTYYLFYNNESNTIIDRPLISDTYNIIQLAYIVDMKKMYIYDYQINI